MTSPTHQLIITADDCGLSEGINNAARALHIEGLLTTATVMMNFSATAHAFEMLANTPTLCAGVHLNLTDGAPLSTVDATCGLVQSDGYFQGRAGFFRRMLFPSTALLAAAETEMRAQIEGFIRAWGRPPLHLTTHMHFHILPPLQQIIFRLAAEYRVEWVRAFQPSSTLIPYNFLLQEPSELFHPDNLKLTPDYIASVQAWMSQDPVHLYNTLGELKGLTELVLHPATPNDPTYPAHMKHPPAERAREQDYLLRLATHLQRGKIHIADPAQVRNR